MLEYATSARRPPSAAPRFHSKARDEPLHAIKDIEESRHSPYVTDLDLRVSPSMRAVRKPAKRLASDSDPLSVGLHHHGHVGCALLQCGPNFTLSDQGHVRRRLKALKIPVFPTVAAAYLLGETRR